MDVLVGLIVGLIVGVLIGVQGDMLVYKNDLQHYGKITVEGVVYECWPDVKGQGEAQP